MANITILNPTNGKTKTITLTMEVSIIAQDLDADIDFFVSLATSAKDISGHAIASQVIRSLADGAGGAALDRHGVALAGGKYKNLTEAINDYVSMMVEGNDGEPGTEMNFA